jgi:archaeosine-15-forming tRNA-guanine transglycosylase
LDKLKAASLSKKINELQNRVIEMQDKSDEQIELMNVFAKHIADLAEELQYEKLDGEGQVQ